MDCKSVAAICTVQINGAQTNGPRCSYGIAGPCFFVYAKDIWHTSVGVQDQHGTWPLCPRSCVSDQIVGGTTRGYQLLSLTLRRDLAKQGRMSEPVASCSSPRVGRRTLSAFLPAVRCLPVGNSREAGSRC